MTEHNTTHFTAEDIEQNRTWAALSYILFFLPMIFAPESKFAKFHANQSLILWIVSIVGNLVLRWIPLIGWIASSVLSLAVFVLFVMGLLNGFNGKAERLPIIGDFELLK